MGRLMDSVLGRVIRKFLEDQAPNWAALIAWNALFAMFPIVVFASSLLGFALRLFGGANDAVYKTIFTAIPGDTTELLKAVSGVKSQSGVLFVIGLVGRELHPLSHLVQAMRKTRQTSEFIVKMGPFFVGYVLHRVP